MKAKVTILMILAIVLGACSSTYRAGIADYDDLYYTPSDAKKQATVVAVEQPVVTQPMTQTVQETKPVAEQELSDYEKYRLDMENQYLSGDAEIPQDEVFEQADTVYTDEQGLNEYAYYEADGVQPVVNNYYYGDVYQDDNSYSTRIRRFQSPYLGYSYYDPWYYDSWNYDPWYYDPWYSGFHMNYSDGIWMGLSLLLLRWMGLSLLRKLLVRIP